MKTLLLGLIAIISINQARAQITSSPLYTDFSKFADVHKSDAKRYFLTDSLQKENEQLLSIIANQYKEASRRSGTVKQNFELYSLIAQFKKDSLSVLTRKFPNLLDTTQSAVPTVLLSDDVNLKTVSYYSDDKLLSKHYPEFYKAVETGTIALGEAPIVLQNHNNGTQLPPLPILTPVSNVNRYKDIYSDYWQWITNYIAVTHCNSQYLDVCLKKEQLLPANTPWKDKAEYRRLFLEFLKTKCRP